MRIDYETVNGRRVPTWVLTAAHKRADESGIEHAAMFLTFDVGMSDGRGGDWFAVPMVPTVRLAGTLIEITEEMWRNAPYVAIPGELQ